ncbi:substrate-binding domain-containing protein [Thermomonospora cellulosilytica]|uniref:ABC-type phosphate transport system substrate-binding protein n=1 Tax=Thermomonospora cellulosilytica TaxID=1411118 RepID=A0A7W3RAL4_9ACTN|nr:substrate-binding domain-containing protein [Thermomonospora cellulosilytica]MBA9005819.1 ABC-type phosphate transport system substrate-binding protein [Thermomonospora cellulosilytica]
MRETDGAALDSYLDRKAAFTRDLVARLGGNEPGALARRTGLLEETVRALLAGDGELMSWEVVSACLAAAGVDGGAAAQVRGRWAAAEQALWDERGDDLRAAFEQNRQGKPAKVAEAHRAKVPWRRLTARHPVTFEPWTVPTFAADRTLPDPATAGDIRDFYALLADLRAWAGSPRQSEIEKRSWGALPDATISAMFQKDRWRTTSDRERTRIGYFAAACGLPEAEVARWVEAYERLRHVPPPDDLAHARAEAAELRRRLAAVQAEAADLRERLAAAENRRPAHRPPPARDTRRDRGRRALSAVVAALLFAGGVGMGAAVGGDGSAAGGPVCFRGTLHLIGSTAFERTAEALRRGYEALCEDADIEVRAIGSNEGVRALTAANAASTIAMHDGYLRPDSDEIRVRGFRRFPVALVAFAVIVHKDANVTGLSVRELRSIYARDGGPTGWKHFRGGADVPIRLVSRTEGSGTRTIFEERVLNEPEPELSSRDCRRKDEIRAAARIIRCERSSQGQVLDTVDQVPGAIGYAELHVAANARRYPNVRILTLDGMKADVSSAGARYPFVAPEVFYTHGPPPNGSPASAFLTFLAGDSARRLLQQAGSPPCLTPGSLLSAPCQPDQR